MKRISASILSFLAILATANAVATANAQSPSIPMPTQDLPILSTNAPLGPRDVIEIRVLEDPSINGPVTITDNGQIVLNLLGKVDVNGLTPAQVENKLKSLLEANFFAKATVSVQVSSYGSNPISVLGAVQHPGKIGASNNITLIQALTQVGGLSNSYGRELYVLRTAQNGLTEQLAIDIDELLVRGNPDLNIPLAPNDVVNVLADTPIVVYMLGEVMKPGPVEFRRAQTPTLLQAIAGAGGQTDRASSKAVIKRIENGKEQTITVNYRKILEGSTNVVLRDNDTVWIKESVF
ncbi:MAG TPA: polysaccharide biosynthesis/export family protein [Thermoanaerobaculia bacterium]|nr:polysaccharide biosynthesis/export family protein [Thermoanaerobaculia bacterium]